MATPNLTAFPKSNSLQFVKTQTAVGQYNFKYWDEWWQCERKTPWEGKVKYNQKVQQDQNVQIVWHSNTGGNLGATVRIYDIDWNDTGAFLSTATVSVSGFEITDPNTGTSYPADTHIAQQGMAALGLPDGRYIFVLETPFTSGTEYQISEPILLRTLHKNTMLIEYTNSVNDYDVFYQTHNILFSLRVESWLHSLTPQSIDTSYEDEQVDITPTYSVPYNTYTYSVRAVPEYMLTRVNFAFSCDVLRLDGRLHTKDKDAKFELTGSNASGLKGMAIAVRETINAYSTTTVTQTPVLVWKVINNGDSGTGTRFPYFVRLSKMNRTGQPTITLMQNLNGPPGPFPYTTDCKEVRDTADEQVLIDHANNVTAIADGQLGSYYIDTTSGDAHFYYQPHPTEGNYLTSVFVILSKKFNVTFQNGAYGSGQFYDIKGSWIGYALDNSLGLQRNAGYGNGNPAPTYLVGGSVINLQNDIARVYHYNQLTSTDTVDRFQAVYPSQTPNINAITGVVPAALTHFRINTGNVSGSYVNFSWSILSPCAANIGDVNLSGNRILIATGPSAFGAGGLPQLYGYDLFKNRLPVGGAVGVDAVFNQLYNGGSKVYVLLNGGINTAGQTPPATPSAASLVARTAISGDGWAILTD